MTDGFHTPIVEIIRGSRASAYVHMAATRLSKAVRAAKGPFPLAGIAGIHPTFAGLADDREALEYLAGIAKVAVAAAGGGTCLVPSSIPEAKERSPAIKADKPPPPPSLPWRGPEFAKALRRLKVYVTDRTTLEWSMPASLWPEQRRFTLRPAVAAPSTKGLAPVEEEVLLRLCLGDPLTVGEIADALGRKSRDIVKAVDTLVIRRLAVDADDVFHAHTLSLRWKNLCETVLESVPSYGPLSVRQLANRLSRKVGIDEVRWAVRYLEAKHLVIVSQHGKKVSRFLPAVRGTPQGAPDRGGIRAGGEVPAPGKAVKRHASPTNVVHDPATLDWTAPLVGVPGTRAFVANPALESDAIDGLPVLAEDVLELLRDYIPRSLARIESALGIEAMDALLPMNVLIARGAVVDGDTPGLAHDRSVAWRGLCGSVLLHCRGREPDDPAEMVGTVPGIHDPETAEAVSFYLTIRGLLTREGDAPHGEAATVEAA